MRSIISLTTDFGYKDPYVGTMKGVILGLNPDASLVDICHSIPPGDIALAGFFLAGAAPYFPPGTVHLAVVDPGVGGDRRCLAVRTGRAYFVAPDNGLLSAVLAGDPPEELVELAERGYWVPSPSSTFQGRDIMGPAAAHISLGVPLNLLGPHLSDAMPLDFPRPERLPDASLLGEVVHTDGFGNLITNIKVADLAPSSIEQTGRLVFEISGRRIRGLKRYYAEGAGLLAVVGSTGYVEIAMRDGSAGKALQVRRGEAVRVYLDAGG